MREHPVAFSEINPLRYVAYVHIYMLQNVKLYMYIYIYIYKIREEV
jgi:hypothetical protein